MKKTEYFNFFRFFLGIFFILASTYRIFFFEFGINEMNKINLPIYFLYGVIILEFILGLSFLFNKKVKWASLLAILFLLIALSIALIGNFWYIISNLGELFVFDANPTDVLLHLTYLFILVFLFLDVKK